MDIPAWLRQLGLERYEPAFRENEIDWEVLPELTEGDLERLSLPLGPTHDVDPTKRRFGGHQSATAGSTRCPSG